MRLQRDTWALATAAADIKPHRLYCNFQARWLPLIEQSGRDRERERTSGDTTTVKFGGAAQLSRHNTIRPQSQLHQHQHL